MSLREILKLRFERLTNAIKYKIEAKLRMFLKFFMYHHEYPAKTFSRDEEKETSLDFFHKHPKDF
jgi:hypothetical protein